jgi:HAD superfamily hydrolase (TIGR01509 family)
MAIKNIIFDLGNVLVHTDFDRLYKAFLSAGVSEESFGRLFHSELFRKRFEQGKLSARDFVSLAVRKLEYKVTKKKFISLFTEMFDEMPDMKNFLKKLVRRKKYKLFLLSNTNALHFNYVKKRYAYINLIKNQAVSYRLKLRKPNKSIYRKVLKKYHLDPAETLFIDDRQINCDAAQQCGINTIHFTDYESFLKQFNLIMKGK